MKKEILVMTADRMNGRVQQVKTARLDLADENRIADWLVTNAVFNQTLTGCCGKVRKSWKNKIRRATEIAVSSVKEKEDARELTESIKMTAEALRTHIKDAASSEGEAAAAAARAVAWENGKMETPPGLWIDPAAFSKEMQDVFRASFNRQMLELIVMNLYSDIDMQYWAELSNALEKVLTEVPGTKRKKKPAADM